jgi:hypothetical protein
MKQGTQSNSIIVDHLILICLGCRAERTFWPDVPLVGAAACSEWLKTKPMRCTCGATHCDVKMHIVNPEVLGQAQEKGARR